MIRRHDMTLRGRLIHCAAVFWTLVFLHSSALAASAEQMAAEAGGASIFWWPTNSTDSNSVQDSAVVSSNTAALPQAAGTNPAPASLAQSTDTNSPPPVEDKVLERYRSRLAGARNLVTTRQFNLAETALVRLLAENVPDEIRQTALLNLGSVVQSENDLPRAQSIFTQFFDRWPGDVRVPEVLLRQGGIFRQMGLNNLALPKYYSVMTAALSLKNDQFAYYQRLVLQAQLEIAETHYQTGKFAEAADFYSRLLKHATDDTVDRPQIQFRLIRSLITIGRNEEASGQALDFLGHYPDADEEPEVRYYLAQSLKAAGQSGEALRQVLVFLREQKNKTKDRPEVWAYWQQRVGNEIANQLYKEGDYVKALEVYLDLSKLDAAPAWRLPVDYQIGITYERLLQPQKAIETYTQILARETALGTNASPGLKAVLDMSRWRIGFLEWQNQAQAATHSFASSSTAGSRSATNTSPETITQ